MKSKVLIFLLLVPLYVMLSGCYQTPRFSNRIAHSDLSTLNIPDSKIERLNIIWKPKDFPEMYELEGYTGNPLLSYLYIGGNGFVRIPTGIAISERLLEVLGQSLTLDETSSKQLEIRISARTYFKISDGRGAPIDRLFNINNVNQVCQKFNEGTVYVSAFFNYKDIELTKTFEQVESVDSKDCSIPSPLEIAWDKVAIEMAQLIVLFINQIENRDISNLAELHKNSLGTVYCTSGGKPQHVELWQCD